MNDARAVHPGHALRGLLGKLHALVQRQRLVTQQHMLNVPVQ